MIYRTLSQYWITYIAHFHNTRFDMSHTATVFDTMPRTLFTDIHIKISLSTKLLYVG